MSSCPAAQNSFVLVHRAFHDDEDDNEEAVFVFVFVFDTREEEEEEDITDAEVVDDKEAVIEAVENDEDFFMIPPL